MFSLSHETTLPVIIRLVVLNEGRRSPQGTFGDGHNSEGVLPAARGDSPGMLPSALL